MVPIFSLWVIYEAEEGAMRAVVQRVRRSAVSVGGRKHGEIAKGLCVLLGVEDADTEEDLVYLSGKIVRLRIFLDENGKMNRSVKDVSGEILLISQFTLYADTRKGNRPSFVKAGRPDYADRMVERFADELRRSGVPVKQGVFGADMLVEIENDGPVTICIDSSEHRKSCSQKSDEIIA